MSSSRDLAGAERIVVKLGTNVITRDGAKLALGRLSGIIENMAGLRHAGREVLLVSSGAVGMGMRALNLGERPSSLGQRQACAAVGQGHLISLYNHAFGELGVRSAQVLLTHEDLAGRERALSLHTTLTRLLELGAVPIINENDSVSVDELVEDERRVFGDNDGLSARVAVSLSADLLILLTDVSGVFDKNPHENPDARAVEEIETIDDDVLKWAVGGSAVGTGGMASKLEAARFASQAGTAVVIASGHEQDIVQRVVEGEKLGTYIHPTFRRRARDRHIAVSGDHSGALVVNDGALRAMTERKASLLPVGVVRIEGRFSRGDLVEIRDTNGRVHGRGLVNYGSGDCTKLMGQHSSEIEFILGWRGYDAMITRTNMVLTQV